MTFHIVKGISIGTFDARITRRKKPDLAVLVADSEDASFACTLTQNQCAAAPVIVTRSRLQNRVRGLIVNSGNANAYTGQKGIEDAETMTRLAADALNIAADAMWVFSTGVVAEPLPMDRIAKGAQAIALSRGSDASDWESFADAILTTDLVRKMHSVRYTQPNGETVTISGIAKGSGMIFPNMATMLSFIATDAAIEQKRLQDLLVEAVKVSFNRISVDGDTSTNDACALVASHAGAKDVDEALFLEKLKEVCLKLAHAIVLDGEGATKFIEINVTGASEDVCLEVAESVAHSPLVKTACFASDPNWGRIVVAIGKIKSPINPDALSIAINETPIVKRGAIDADYSEEKGQEAMAPKHLTMDIDLGEGGEGEATMWTCDLSYDYVKINADYRS